MSAISKDDVLSLREKTGAGLIDCKRALVESNGDLEEAVSILRKKGVATAAKKAGRSRCRRYADARRARQCRRRGGGLSPCRPGADPERPVRSRRRPRHAR